MTDASTPGPWSLDGIAITAGRTTICWMGEPAQCAGDSASTCENAKANATLIVSAPELVEALREARKAAADMAARCRERARDYDEQFNGNGDNNVWRAEEIHWCRVVDRCDAAIVKAMGEGGEGCLRPGKS